jgi:hypothetical protein
MTWNTQAGLPARTSKACTSPRGASLNCGPSEIDEPTATTSRQMIGGEVIV